MASPRLNFAAIPDAHVQGGNLRHLPEIVDRINALAVAPDFVISLGDALYGLEGNDVLADARAYQAQVDRLRAPHYYVIGNHEAEPVERFKLLTWDELLAAWRTPALWYSFEVHGFHCCVLYTWSELVQPEFAATLAAQSRWLAQDLNRAAAPVIVFSHEALGFAQDDCPHWIQTDNRLFWPGGNELERILARYRKKIVAVFEGHKHKSLHKRAGGVSYHLLGAAYQHGGQFAQVFLEGEGCFFVQAYPEVAEQDAEQTIQQTYGDPRLRDSF